MDVPFLTQHNSMTLWSSHCRSTWCMGNEVSWKIKSVSHLIIKVVFLFLHYVETLLKPQPLLIRLDSWAVL